MSVVVNSLTRWTGVAASSHYDGAATGRARTLRPGWQTRFLLWCDRCLARSQQRQALAQLDDHLLKDIGKTRHEAFAEAAKPFWK